MPELNVVLIDCQDSFVYNLADALHVMGARVEVYRNTVPTEQVLARAQGKTLCLSPGPGTPAASGNLMEIIDRAWGRIPMLGVCLGFQAMMQHCGMSIERVGPVHGQASLVTVSEEGRAILGDAPRVARYHSLGTRAHCPEGWQEWARTDEILMAAGHPGAQAAGFQFHPESVLTPGGTAMLEHALTWVGAQR